MRVWLLQTSEQLPVRDGVRKLRTRLLAEALAARGHSVVWWASCFNHLRKEWYFDRDTEFQDGPALTVRALKGFGYRRNVSLARFADHRRIARKFSRAASRSLRPDLIVASLPSHDLAEAAVRFARARGVPIIVDVRDKWPHNFLDAAPCSLRWLARIALAGEFRRTRNALRGADAILSMTSPLLEWALQIADRSAGPNDRVFYLGAYRELDGVVPSALRSLIESRLKGKCVVTFVGTFSTYHNPEIALAVARRFRDRPDIVFVLAGDGDLAEELRRRAAALDNVVFTGWLESAGIAALLGASHLGLCTTGAKSERFFLPNKVFAYLAEGVPIASAFDGELRDLIDQEKIGFNFRDEDELAGAIRSMAASAELRRSLSDNAARFFRSRCNAEVIYPQFVEHLERIAARRGVPSAGSATVPSLS
ncbi:MAG: glycosyltransferase family 4 protein [Acidobacteria bacterium]|nr:glycosyltransferase family 4 protein [Acidobacteriota bacterium]